jgi:hypothetical protein
MANTIKLKSSAVPGKVPSLSDLQVRELALNTADGRLFTRKSSGGVDSIVDLSGGGVVSPVAETSQVISENYTFGTGKNAISVSPVEVAATYTVTVPANAIWMVL